MGADGTVDAVDTVDARTPDTGGPDHRERRDGDLPGPDTADLDIFSVLQALSDPVRAQIVCLLDARGTEIPIGGFGLRHLPKSSCTYHFKVLREAGLITQRAAGNRRMNRLRTADLEERFPGLLHTVLTAYRAAERAAAPG